MNSAPVTILRKGGHLVTSRTVTRTGPNQQPRILEQKISSNAVGNNLQTQVSANNRCYVCDDALSAGQAQHLLSKMSTSHTATQFPNKIGHLVGEAFTVIISADDVVCARCTNLINYLDRLENDVERVRSNLINLLHKKYGLNDDGISGDGSDVPPQKMQKLNSNVTVVRVNTADYGGATDANRKRKVVHMLTPTDSSMGKQSPPVSAVQQIKISTQPTQQTSPQQLNASPNTQTVQRKTAKIYKCLTCEYKTSDMRLFNTHYETCKQQNFQCKNCKKIFPNFGTMKQHMVREHNTSMDNTCSVCHINFVSEGSLRKHMELNHSTNVLVTTTVPMSTVVNEVATPLAATSNSPVASAATTPLYSCAHCAFKTTDKQIYDEHVRKHISSGKPKPFKCRLCSQRFETRVDATVHAKQHQPNYFKCGTCSMSFSKREELVKHFEVRQQQNAGCGGPVCGQQNVQQTVLQQNTTTTKQVTPSSASPQNLLTTQKLLQETIDEALSDTVTTPAPASTDITSAAANNIRFYSCNVCSLTFLQENYYNQHMETHRRDDKKSTSGGTANNATSSGHLNAIGNSGSNTMNVVTIKKGDNGLTNAQQIDPNSAEADIESIFEKMHSEKSDADTVTTMTSSSSSVNKTSGTDKVSNTIGNGERSKSGTGQDNLVITSHEVSGDITFNITIPEAAAGSESNAEDNSAKKSAVSIDMPTLDQPDDVTSSMVKMETKDEKLENNESNTSKANTSTAPVSMPSLDDDGEAAEQQAAENVGVKRSSGNTSPIETRIKTDGDNIKLENETEKNASAGSHTGETSQHDESDEKTTESNAEHQQQASDNNNAEHNDEVGDNDGLTAEHLAAAAGEHQQVAMELDEAMQAQVESGQIKFILNENGQLLQLDNHIITDAEGNQIIVQDSEQIQQLLQSVGVLQSGDAIDGETLQMMTDNGQMVLVHGENNETQLIDASLLNAEGQLVIQQGQDGELGEGTHVISEDGTRIPVSVSYTADGQPIVQVQQVMNTSASAEDAALEEKVATATGESTEISQHNDSTDESSIPTSQASSVTPPSSGGFFALEELMHQQQQQQQQQHEVESKAAE